MGWKNKTDLHAYLARHRARMSRHGRTLEDDVERLLEKMKARGDVSLFVRNSANSAADAEGKDFTVTKKVDGVDVVRHFGVTISTKSHNNAKVRYPDVPQFHFPIGTNPTTIEKRILELFRS